MTQKNWQQVKEILIDAMRQPPEQRPAFLDRACSDDKDLRREVESLLSSYDSAESFLESPAFNGFDEIIEEKNESLREGASFAHYKIIRLIGAGGMGEVYLAQDSRLKRKVGLKILHKNIHADKEHLRRFEQEACAASALNHQNILTVYEFGAENNLHFIAAEFVEGETLRERIKKTTVKLSEALDIAVQIASALSAAHESGIIHRDIKPENIMIRSDGLVKILDFGLAKLIDQSGRNAIDKEASTKAFVKTASGMIMGTPAYMSPEQARGKAADIRTDIWSLGCVLYEMLSGEKPFAGETSSDILAAILKSEPVPLSHYFTDIPKDLERIVNKCLRKNAEERYQHTKDLLIDLKEIKEELEFAAKLERSSEPASKEETKVKSTAVTEIRNIQNVSNAEYSLYKIKRNKSYFLFGLSILLLAATGSIYWYYKSLPVLSGIKQINSVAVLPFVNASQDPNAEYLSDGITESVNNYLSQLSALKVMSKNSTFRFKNNQSDTRGIASQLGVESIITGDIRQIGDRFVINVRLINAGDDSQIWGNQYVKTPSDIIEAQNEIARDISRNLGARLSSAEERRLMKKYTENPEAYQLYLKGRLLSSKLTRADAEKAIGYLQQAIEIDPNFTLAYAGIAHIYRRFAITSDVPSKEIMPKAKDAALKAIQIDPEAAEAYVALGSIAFWYEWDWQAAEKHFLRALELDPNNVDALRAYAHLLSNAGRHEQALDLAKRARELDPLTLYANALEGQFLYFAGKRDEALDQLKKTIDLDETFWLTYLIISRVYEEKGMHAEAIAAAEKAGELSKGNTESIALAGYSQAKAGNTIEARAVLNKLSELSQSQTRYVPPYNFALVYNGLGEEEKTLDYLEKGITEKDVRMVFLKVDPKWDNLRGNTRFQNLVARIG